VRIHTGANAAQMNESLNAKAFTLGNNIAFAPNQYSANTSTGRNLLGHELAHVVQQRSLSGGAVQGKWVQRSVSKLPRLIAGSTEREFSSLIGVEERFFDRWARDNSVYYVGPVERIKEDWKVKDFAIVNEKGGECSEIKKNGTKYECIPYKFLSTDVDTSTPSRNEDELRVWAERNSYYYVGPVKRRVDGWYVKDYVKVEGKKGGECSEIKDNRWGWWGSVECTPPLPSAPAPSVEVKADNQTEENAPASSTIPIRPGEECPPENDTAENDNKEILVCDKPTAKSWTLDDLAAYLCSIDKKLVDELSKTEVVTYDYELTFYHEYDGKKWVDVRYYNTTQGEWDPDTNTLGLSLRINTLEEAAMTIFHELIHKKQFSNQAFADRNVIKMELDAWTRTEQWTIDKGLPGEYCGNLRKKDEKGKTVVDVEKIKAVVEQNYGKSTGSRFVVTGREPPDGEHALTVLENGERKKCMRAPKVGDSYKGKKFEGDKEKVPNSIWVCKKPVKRRR